MSIYAMELVWRGYPGGGSDLLCMLAMGNWCDDQGNNLFPSVSKVAQRIRTSDSQARRVLHKLIEEGWIKVVGNANGGAPGNTRRYAIDLMKLETAGVGATPSTSATPSTDARDGLHGCASTAGMGASLYVKEQPSVHVNKTTRAKKTKSAEAVDELGVNDLVAEGVDPQHAKDWLQVRRKKKAPLTVTAWSSVKAEAAKAGLSLADAVQMAASKSWQGFEASWLQGRPAAAKAGAVATKHAGFDQRAYGEGGAL